MIHKRMLAPDRVRRPPTDGWSWIDRRFVRDCAPRLSHEAIVLYFFLAAVADKDGLSFYSDATTAARLRMREESVVDAREELIREDLVAYRTPLTQVLSLPRLRVERRGGELVQLGELFRTLADAPPILIPGVCHEGFPLGRDSPLARNRRTQKASDCPASALLHQDH
jgi:hypothetical protein